MVTAKLKLSIDKINPAQLKGGVKLGQKLEFGKEFADRMFQMRFTPDKGWQDAVIKKFENFSLSPAALVLHYAQTMFEGMKAYYRADGKIGLFRPRDNFLRMNTTAKRLCMPELDVDFAVTALKELLILEKNWVPKEAGTSLYIRPTMIGVDPKIGLKASEEYLFYIIMSPVGTYYKNGFAPVGIIVEEEYVRAVRGGIGSVKAGANYAASLYPGKKAQEKGFDQVLWLDGVEQRYVEEVGTMNIFFVYGDEVVTSALNGSILPGITRDSVLKLAKSWGLKTKETKLDIQEVVKDIKKGKITEAFGAGTAAVIAPVGHLNYQGKDIQIADGASGKITTKLYENLTGIQYGKLPDPFGWTEVVG